MSFVSSVSVRALAKASSFGFLLTSLQFLSVFVNASHFSVGPDSNRDVGKNQMCCLCGGFLQLVYNVSYKRSSGFKAITCLLPQKFIKCVDIDFTTLLAIALLHCYLLPLFNI